MSDAIIVTPVSDAIIVTDTSIEILEIASQGPPGVGGGGAGGATVIGAGVILVQVAGGASTVSLLEDATHRFATDAEKAAWSAKQAALGFTPEAAGIAAGLMTAHTAASDPHAQYTTAPELASALAGKANAATTLAGYGITDAEAGGAAAGLMSAHAGAADPHPGYALESALPASTDGVPEGAANQYFTAARVRAVILSGLSLAAGTVVDATHSVLQALGFLQKQASDNATAIASNATAIATKASLGGAETLTNKRINPRIGSAASSATPAINTDSIDIYKLTAQAEAITSFSSGLTGAPVDGQCLIVQITGTAARLIAWGASFEASTVALPTTTVTTAMLAVGFIYNGATAKWRCAGAV